MIFFLFSESGTLSFSEKNGFYAGKNQSTSFKSEMFLSFKSKSGISPSGACP